MTARDTHAWEKYQEQKRMEKSSGKRGPATMEGVGGTPQLLPCHVPWSLSPLSPWAAPQQAHHCGTGCVESHRRLGAGGMRLCSKRVNKSIFKWEAVGEGMPPRAGLLCRWQGLARGLEAQGQVSASPCCFLGGGGKPHQL